MLTGRSLISRISCSTTSSTKLSTRRNQAGETSLVRALCGVFRYLLSVPHSASSMDTAPKIYPPISYKLSEITLAHTPSRSSQNMPLRSILRAKISMSIGLEEVETSLHQHTKHKNLNGITKFARYSVQALVLIVTTRG